MHSQKKRVPYRETPKALKQQGSKKSNILILGGGKGKVVQKGETMKRCCGKIEGAF